MQTKRACRRSPADGKWSKCKAAIDAQGGQITIPFFYEDEIALRRDWNNVGEWRRIAGATAREQSVRLEKTRKGRPWIDFGTRARYQHGITGNGSPYRLAIPVEAGGKSRPTLIKAVRESQTMYAVFVFVPPDELNGELQRLALTGTVCSAPGTTPIELSGLEVFGRFIRVGSHLPRIQEPA